MKKTLFFVSSLLMLLSSSFAASKAPIQTVIFDYGNVMTESEKSQFFWQLKETLKLNEEEIQKLIFQMLNAKKNNIPMQNFLANHFKGKIPNEWIEQLRNMQLDTIGLNEEMVSCVEQLKRNQYHVILLSNITKELAEIIQKLGHYDLFDQIFLSCDIGYEKPDKEAYLHVLSTINSSPETCLFIDDMKENIEAANELGIHTIHYDPSCNISEELSKFNIQITP